MYDNVSPLFVGFLNIYRIFLSETYEVIDAMFRDTGIKDDPQQNNKWLNQNNYFTIDVGTNGTTITEPSTGQGSSNFCPATTQTSNWNERIILTAPTCIEFELTNVFDLSLRVNANGTSYSRSLSESGRYKVKINLENVEVWINDVKQSNLTSNSIDFTQSCNLSFIGSNNANIGTLTFKDYKMYLI